MEGTSPAHREPSPVTTAPTELTPDMVTDETHVQTVKVAVVEAEMRTSLPPEHQAELQTADTSAAGAATPPLENGAAGENPEMEVMESNPVTTTEGEPHAKQPCADEAKAKSKEKGQSGARKYGPSKKAMTDPLKMDTLSSLEMHITSSMLSRQCDECHIIFSDNKSKERHLKLSHRAEYEQCILKNTLFACYVCDRHFTNSTELMAHQKTHTDKKPFKCPICGLAFRKSTELTFHKKSHFDKNGYTCTDCGKPCKTLTLLKYHRRAHTGEMPYICKECGKRFSMPKALQKHILSHSAEGAEVQEGDAAAKTMKNDGNSTVRYSCSMCKASFKSTKTRRYHMKTKHNLLPSGTRNQTSAKLQVKQSTPVITPISVCQPGLLQLEPNGPLQRVDANVDTEQICRLIESLGNVQKVNQVVILGQVPPHAAPLELQQLTHLTEAVNLNPQTLGLNDVNNQCDPMEQTIILEPITPDGQLENAAYSELGAHIGVGEDIQLTLVHSADAERPEGDVMGHINAVQSEHVDQLVCHSDINLEQTVILELTPALIPTSQLELSHAGQHDGTPLSSLVSSSEMAKSPDHPPQGEEEGGTSGPQLISAAELVLTGIQTEQGDIPPTSVVSPGTLTQSLSTSESNLGKDEDSQMRTEKPEEIHNVMDSDAPQGGVEKVELALSEQKRTEKLPQDEKQDPVEQESSAAKEETSTQNNLSAKKEVSETKQKPQISELPVSVMSAQELVKVRKRKPARAFFFQGYIQEQISSVYSDDFQLNARPAKRQRNKKSHLVVKIGPQGKEKRNKKQKKASHQHQTPQEDVATNVAQKKVAPASKKGRKRKKERQVGHLVSTAEGKLPSSIRGTKVKKIKEHAKKTQLKKQEEDVGEGVAETGKPQTSPPVFGRKKQATTIKDQTNNPKEKKRMKNLAKAEKVVPKAGTGAATKQGSPITQDSLLLLRGHKQPQLKVYKLDPSKASSQAQGTDPQEPQTQQSKDDTTPAQESANKPAKGSGKKGGRPKKNSKVLSLLSSLNASCQPTEATPTKPKTTRKRKSSSKIETEGVITSKQALHCKDCGQRFNELSSLQKHKATVHMLDSPDLTYTNGNIFEGVSRLNVAADWDIEPELGEKASEYRETTVSFPTLIPSPSLPVLPPADTDVSDRSQTSRDVKQLAMSETSGSSLRNDVLSKDLETAEPSASESQQEKATQKHPSSDAEDKGDMEEDVKENLFLEVDLVTVGEQNEKEGSTLKTSPERNESRSPVPEGGNSDTPNAAGQAVETPRAKSLTSQTVSFSTHQEEIKEEEEEMLVQRRKRRVKGANANNVVDNRREESGAVTETVQGGDGGSQSEKEQNECEVVFEKHPVNPDLEDEDERQVGIQTCQTETRPESPDDQSAAAAAAAVERSPLIPSVLEGSAEEQVVFELESVTTSVDEVMNEEGVPGGDEQDRDTDRSPGIVLEKFLTFRQKESANKTRRSMMARDSPRPGNTSGTPEIKVEETLSLSDSPPLVPVCRDKENPSVQRQQQHDVLVKEESLVRWNMEPVNDGNGGTPIMRDEETTDCCVTKEFHSVQCIFYPVKEEEREVPIETTVSSRGTSTPTGSSAGDQPELRSADGSLCEGSHAAQDNQGTRDFSGVSEFADGQDDEWPNPPELQDFLLRSSNTEETVGVELSDPQLRAEEEIMAYFYKNRHRGPPHPAAASQSEVTSPDQLRVAGGGTSSKKPIDYFSTYFGWDTWVDVAHCTNLLSNVTTSVLAKEVAQFVGIHIAMGTLKFPSPKLYWQDLTKVPLICDAMLLSRFSELSRVLRLAVPPGDPTNRHVQEERRDGELRNRPQKGQSVGPHSFSTSQTDPLWKVQPLLSRFTAGCQALRRQDNYAVDQYLIPLTGEQHNRKYSFPCTTLIGFGGLLLHLDLKVNLSDKEEAVEKMVPRGSTVFLCKQELSTPAMLERLLAAGVHGAGRVGGARGQIGDEFVSSDGKLMLRRSHCGFILSTAGIEHRNMASMVDSFEKAHMSAHLNRDLRQLYPIPVTASAATCWPQAVLWYLTDQALVNSWLQYRQDHKEPSAPLTFMDFRLEVSKSLILSSGSDAQDSVPPHPPTEKTHATNEGPSPSLEEESPLPDVATRYDGSGHWPEQLGEGEGGRCRFGDCQRTSRVLCLKCCVFLCISRSHNCFLNFHNQASSGKE